MIPHYTMVCGFLVGMFMCVGIAIYIYYYSISLCFDIFQKHLTPLPVRLCGSTSGRQRMWRSMVRLPAPRCCSGQKRSTFLMECTSGKLPTRTDPSTAPRELTLIYTHNHQSIKWLMYTFVYTSFSKHHYY